MKREEKLLPSPSTMSQVLIPQLKFSSLEVERAQLLSEEGKRLSVSRTLSDHSPAWRKLTI